MVLHSKLLLSVFVDFLKIFQDISVSYNYSIIFYGFSADLSIHSYNSDQVLSFVELNLYFISFAPTHHKNLLTFLNLCILDAETFVSFEQRNVYFLSAHNLICM